MQNGHATASVFLPVAIAFLHTHSRQKLLLKNTASQSFPPTSANRRPVIVDVVVIVDGPVIVDVNLNVTPTVIVVGIALTTGHIRFDAGLFVHHELSARSRSSTPDRSRSP